MSDHHHLAAGHPPGPGLRRFWRRIRVSEGTATALFLAGVFVVLFGRVLLGRRVLIAGDVLYGLLPWSAAAGAHAPANPILSDPVLQVLPWQMLTRAALLSGRLPLWNPLAFAGSPLMANDQSAPFSPFNLLALPFSAQVGLSLAMLAKLWAAGVGTALFLRRLGARGWSATLGGLAFATSSFMVVWLGYAHTGVAALIPFGFAATEWYAQSRRRVALAALALVLGLQFLAGHVETSVHFAGALGIYALARVLSRPPRRRDVALLALAALVGCLLAAIQLLPFAEVLSHAPLTGYRRSVGFGLIHLGPTEAASWLFPNSRGNPAIDGLYGRAPNFNESTGFAGVGALVLAPLGLWHLWGQRRAAAISLGLPALFGALVVYGPLSPLAGRLPLLDVSNNLRILVLLCFVVAVFAGMGLEALLAAPIPSRVPRRWRVVVAAGTGALAAVGVALVVFLRLGPRVDTILPAVHGNLGFWLATGLASLLCALCLVGAGRWGGLARPAAAGLTCLAALEATLFAWPFNPQERPNDVPPATAVTRWLTANAADAYIATVGSFVPESASLYGLHDVGGYDLTIDPRVPLFWAHADPGFQMPAQISTNLARPDARWLAAAGVAFVVKAGDQPLPGTYPVLAQDGVTVSAVPGARPFAFLAPSTVSASGPEDAVSVMARDPDGPVVVEGGCCSGPQLGGQVTVRRRDPGEVEISVRARGDTTLVVLQSYSKDWRATVDGHASSVLPANILFQSLRVPAGVHLVRLWYDPPSVRAGALGSIGGIAGLLALGIRLPGWRRRRRQQAARE